MTKFAAPRSTDVILIQNLNQNHKNSYRPITSLLNFFGKLSKLKLTTTMAEKQIAPDEQFPTPGTYNRKLEQKTSKRDILPLCS